MSSVFQKTSRKPSEKSRWRDLNMKLSVSTSPELLKFLLATLMDHWKKGPNLQVDLPVDSWQLTNPLDSATDLGCIVYWVIVETWENFLLVSWTYTPHESNNISYKEEASTVASLLFSNSHWDELMRTSGAGRRRVHGNAFINMLAPNIKCLEVKPHLFSTKV